VEAVNRRVAAQVFRAARYAGPLLIVLVSASCGCVIGVAASTARLTPCAWGRDSPAERAANLIAAHHQARPTPRTHLVEVQ
jgi:hypothetical protein